MIGRSGGLRAIFSDRVTFKSGAPVKTSALLTGAGALLSNAGRTAAVTLALVALAACQTDKPNAVSLDVARENVTRFEQHPEQSEAALPPRTIVDIEALLSSQPPANAQAVRSARALLSTPLPVGASDAELFRIHRSRSAAAARLGNIQEILKEVHMALDLAPKGAQNALELVRAVRVAMNAEFNAGNFANYVALRERHLVEEGSFVDTFLAIESDARAGDIDGARRKFERAEPEFLALRKTSGGIVKFQRTQATYLRAKSVLQESAGQFDDAESSLILALEKWTEHRGALTRQLLFDSVRGTIINRLIQVQLRQGKVLKAEATARSGLHESLEIFGTAHSRTADHMLALSQVLNEQARYGDAKTILRFLLKTYQGLGYATGSRFVLAARLELADTLAAEGAWAEALVNYQSAEASFGGANSAFRGNFKRSPAFVIALVNAGQKDEALRRAKELVEFRSRNLGAESSDAALAYGVAGMAYAVNDRLAEALDSFQKALPVIFKQILSDTSGREGRALNDVWTKAVIDAYLAALDRVNGTELAARVSNGVINEGFMLAQIGSARSVQKSLLASSARAAARDPELAALARQEQDVIRRMRILDELIATTAGRADAQRGDGVLDRLKQQRQSVAQLHAALAAEIQTRFPEYYSLMARPALSVAAAGRLLVPGEALLKIYTTDTRTYAWTVSASGKVAYVASDLGRERLEDMVGVLRRSLDPGVSRLGEIPEFDVRTSHEIYRHILAPVASNWTGLGDLLAVIEGPLAQLPLSVLVTEGQTLGAQRAPLFSRYRDISWLARSHAVSVLPSVSSLEALRKLPPANANRKAFVGFGDPVFSVADRREGEGTRRTPRTSGGLNTRGRSIALRNAPQPAGSASAGMHQLPRLADTADEIRSIAGILNADADTDVFIGNSASEGRVKSIGLDSYRTVAFATHGLVPGDLDGLLQPALALSSPGVVGGSDDGLLTAGEILGLLMDADWVVLSACNTGAAGAASAEAFSGLGRAFFYAGTRALLLSNWPVETVSARLLTTDVFREQALDPSVDRAEALRNSMLRMIDETNFSGPDDKVVFSYAHPIFWAPFSIVGDPGGVHTAATN